MSLPAYPEYKESGVSRIGKLPSHWSLSPLKRNFILYGGSTPKSDEEKYWNGEIVWVSPADLSKLSTLYIDNSARKITCAGLEACATNLVPKGTIILSTRAPIGSLAIADTELCTNQGCKSLVPKAGVNPLYFTYCLLASTEALQLHGKGTTFLELSADELGAFKLPFPSYAEQTAIATFLDRQTLQIDALIAEQEKFLTLLVEKRQATISHAVTRGLNPDAPMKDSGVAWLGEVPTYWEVVALKRYWTVTDCKHLTAEFVENGFPLASIREVQSRYVALENAKQTTSLFYEQLIEGGRKPITGDLIFSRNATVGEVAQVTEQHPAFAMGQDVCLLRKMHQSYSSDYLQAVICSEVVIEQLKNIMVGSTFKRVNVEEIRRLIIPMPPKIEQINISKFIEREYKKFSLLEKQLKNSINLLLERRAALISAAVTGKIDVRNAVGKGQAA